MKTDKALREHLVYLLKEGGAHAAIESSIVDVPFAAQGKRPEGVPHSPWEELEHIRIAQRDILEFMRNAKHVSPKWPEGYWPESPVPPDQRAWDQSVKAILDDLDSVAQLVSNEETDLFAKIPHGDGQTILREVLLVADHNAYHLGQLVLTRRLLGVWKR